MTQKMPSVFISHGPPSILLMESPVSDFLKKLRHDLPVPKAILCISAHFEAYRPILTSAPDPQLIYDFGGPPQLFNETYPVKGSPELAENAMTLLKENGIMIQENNQRGLDHGVWVPLKLMFSGAEIPVVQLSVQTEMDASHHYELGKALRPLREQGVLILGSGGAVHNLDEIHQYKRNDPPTDYALAFDRWLEKSIKEGQEAQLIDFKREAPEPEKSHPYPAEHFLPLLVCLGSGNPENRGKKIHHGFMFGTLSMAAYQWD